MTVILHHMDTSLLEQAPEKTAALVDSFGADAPEREAVLKLLVQVLALDGNATRHIDLRDGALHDSKNEKKIGLTFEAIMARYTLGKEKIAKAVAEQVAKEAATKFEQQIFGKLLADVLAERGIDLKIDKGKTIKAIRAIIAHNAGLSAEVLRKKIEQEVFTKK